MAIDARHFVSLVSLRVRWSTSHAVLTPAQQAPAAYCSGSRERADMLRTNAMHPRTCTRQGHTGSQHMHVPLREAAPLGGSECNTEGAPDVRRQEDAPVHTAHTHSLDSDSRWGKVDFKPFASSLHVFVRQGA